MSKQLHTAFKLILAMPYYKNDHAQSGVANHSHEEAVAVAFRTAGFTEVPKTSYPKLTGKILKPWAKGGSDQELRNATVGMPNGSFIIQPAGSQGFPDILIKDFCGRFVAVECKSAKGTCPMWNDNVPRPDSIYIFCSFTTNETTIFMGRDVITPAMYDAMEAVKSEVVKFFKTQNHILAAADGFKRGWALRIRWQNCQAGGAKKTNYFTHEDREACETNALMYAND
jgi:hypothetical protein